MIQPPSKIALATTNSGKISEFRELLRPLAIEVVPLRDAISGPFEVDETGDTFEANATLKATAAARASGLWALADDSGLEVDALGGAPGVYSARFAGRGASDTDNMRKLMESLAGIEHGARTARFRCVLALVDPNDLTQPRLVVEGCCEGAIATTKRGTGGFGYDPLFIVSGGTDTMAELAQSQKNQLSHRARACMALVDLLRRG